MINTKVVNVEILDEALGERFSGTFTVKRLTIRDNSTISARRVQLNGGMHVGENGVGIDPETNGLNHMLATLEVAIVAAPKGFSVDELVSLPYMAAIYKEVDAFQDTFLRGRKSNENVGREDRQSQERSVQTPTSAQGQGSSGEALATEVQYSLDP